MLADSGGWEVDMGYLKIVVKIPDTIYPELVADLQRVQLRDRAERVRVLAMLGLNSGLTVSKSEINSIADTSHQPPHQNKKSLIQRLADSV
jgi:hypothetical protein